AVVAGAKAGDPSAPIDPASVLLTSPTATDAGKTLETYRGTWRVQADGSVRFSPADGFVGTTPAVGYSVADRNRTRTASTMTVTVRPGPTAGADHLSTPKGAAVSVAPLANDVPGTEADGSDGSFVTATLAFPTDGQPAGGAVTDAGHTLTVPDEGVWTAGSGIVTFTPAAGFAGGATPVSYAASDDLGKVARGRITAAVTSEVPAATDDEAATTYATPVRLAGATNDSPGSSSLTSAATVFPAAGQPASATVSTDGKTLTVPGQGTWRLASDGSVTFSPAAGYAGTTAPATYQVVDGAGRTASATLTVVVRPGPAGHPDTVASGYFDVLVPVAQNDTPGRAADGSLGTIDPLTVRFAQTGQPSGWVVSADGYLATRRLSSDGSSARLAIDTVSGEVDVYVPAGFGGVLGPLVYTASDRVLDATGVARRHPFTSALQVTATRLEPIATDDHAVTTNQVPAFLAGQSNDLPTGEPNLPLQVEGTSFPSDQLGRFPVGSRIDGDQLIVAGEGTYGNNGIDGITFVPVPTFTGDTTPVEYQVEDWLGRTARATLTVTVLPGAVARPDTAATPQDATVNVDVLANDDTGSSLNGVPLTRADFDGAYFASTRQPAGSKLSPYQDKLTVPGQGVYSVNPGNATITFDPESQFRGVASQITVGLHLSVPRASVFAPYQVDLTSTLRVTVVGAVPLAHPDTASTQVGRPVVLKALANDAAGSSTVPLVGSSVRLRLASGLPTGSTLSGDAKRLTVAERGVFLAAGNGDITFVPLGTRTGGVPTIGYQVADANGTTTRSTLTVTVS
ncbi:MAG: Ig-like domain-containing protein, partial [Janthinobacterium lividum]